MTTRISKAYLNLKLNEEKILSTLKDVLVRQNELSNAKSKNINAIHDYNLSLDELERLTFLEISKNCLDYNNKVKESESICNIPR